MCDRETLTGIRDVSLLQQWMYADGNHTVTVENQIGTPLELSMNEDAEVMCRNLLAQNVAPFPYDDMLGIPIWLGIIVQLKAQPPRNPATGGKSRWDEIRTEAAIIRTLNS